MGVVVEFKAEGGGVHDDCGEGELVGGGVEGGGGEQVAGGVFGELEVAGGAGAFCGVFEADVIDAGREREVGAVPGEAGGDGFGGEVDGVLSGGGVGGVEHEGGGDVDASVAVGGG